MFVVVTTPLLWRIGGESSFILFKKKQNLQTIHSKKVLCKTHYYQIKVKPNILVLFFKKQSE